MLFDENGYLKPYTPIETEMETFRDSDRLGRKKGIIKINFTKNDKYSR